MIYLAHFSFRKEFEGGYFTAVIDADGVDQALTKLNDLLFKAASKYEVLEKTKVVYLEEITEIEKAPSNGFISYIDTYPKELCFSPDPESAKKVKEEKVLLLTDITFKEIKKYIDGHLNSQKLSIINKYYWLGNKKEIVLNKCRRIVNMSKLVKDKIVMDVLDKVKAPGKVVCVMPTHRRESITTETLKMLKNQTMLIEILVVGDSDTEKKVAQNCGCHYIEHENKPLSKKWQAGIAAAKKMNPDAIMICGSDSWITPKWCEIVFPYTRVHDLVGINNFYACRAYPKKKVNIIHREYKGHRSNLPVGSGRMFSKRILEKVDWVIYPGSKNKALDSQSYRTIMKHKAKILTLPDKELKVLAIKSTWDSLNSWERYIASTNNIRHPDVENPKKWLENNFPGSIESLNRVVSDLKW